METLCWAVVVFIGIGICFVLNLKSSKYRQEYNYVLFFASNFAVFCILLRFLILFVHFYGIKQQIFILIIFERNI